MRIYLSVLAVAILMGCDPGTDAPASSDATKGSRDGSAAVEVARSRSDAPATPALVAAREGFVTRLVSRGEPAGPPGTPPDGAFELIHYEAPVGRLAAYVTSDPGDGQRHPALVWITGGDTNSIDDVWSPQDRENDQSASAFRRAGIVMMFPSQRGGNDNPGEREGFYGEVDDVLAATDYLAQLPYVDPNQIYLGGHSTGGTLVMLVAACSDRYRAVFAFGPVADINEYGGAFVYCDLRDEKEMMLRSPIHWLDGVNSPMYVFEGSYDGNWWSIDRMARNNSNENIHFLQVPGHDHFSVIAPITEMLAKQIIDGQINVSSDMVQNLQ